MLRGCRVLPSSALSAESRKGFGTKPAAQFGRSQNVRVRILGQSECERKESLEGMSRSVWSKEASELCWQQKPDHASGV